MVATNDLDVGRLAAALEEAEDDGDFGVGYTPRRAADAIADIYGRLTREAGEAGRAAIERDAMLRLLDELEVGFSNNPRHHSAVIFHVREAIEQGRPMPSERLSAAIRAEQEANR